ncbi:MAG: hypothetical protein AB1Z23_08180 [Eubacteriales bacterium]
MEKHLKIIVIAAMIIILVFLSLIVVTMLKDKDTQPISQNNPEEEVHSKKDYVISQSTTIYPDIKAQMGENPSRMTGIVNSITYDNGEAVSFNILGTDNISYDLYVSDMKLIDIKYSDDPSKEEVDLTYKTGGIARIIPGGYLYLYKDESSKWSLDERVLFGGSVETMSATVVDIEFAPMSSQNGHILASYLVLEDSAGQQHNLYFSAINVQSIMTGGEMTIYYDSHATDENVYKVKESDGFSIQLATTDGGSYIFAKGSPVNLQRSSKKGYWELQKQVDKTTHRATVKDIVFSHDDDNITGIDYVVASLDDGTSVYLTMMQMQVLYGTPTGNYKRIYRYNGKDIVLDEVKPNEDFVMELNYEGGKSFSLFVGSEIWIGKSDDDIYMLDYEYTYNIYESRKAD